MVVSQSEKKEFTLTNSQNTDERTKVRQNGEVAYVPSYSDKPTNNHEFDHHIKLNEGSRLWEF